MLKSNLFKQIMSKLIDVEFKSILLYELITGLITIILKNKDGVKKNIENLEELALIQFESSQICSYFCFKRESFKQEALDYFGKELQMIDFQLNSLKLSLSN